MFKNLLKQRFKYSQSNSTINRIKKKQKLSLSAEYRRACSYKTELQALDIETSYIDAYWSSICNDILSIYDSEDAFSQFGQNNVIISTMIGDPVRNMYTKFKNLIIFDQEDDLCEEWFGNFRINVPKFNSTGQRLGHIYVANMISEILKAENQKVVKVNEIGGGFGGLAKTLEKRIRAETYTIIDLWQILPLQRAYLNLTRNEEFTDYQFVPIHNDFIVNDANVLISNGL